MRNRLADYAGPHYSGEFQEAQLYALRKIHERQVKDVRAVWFMWGFVAACVFATLVSVIR